MRRMRTASKTELTGPLDRGDFFVFRRFGAPIDRRKVEAAIGDSDDFAGLPRPRHAFSTPPGLHRPNGLFYKRSEFGVAVFTDEFGQGHLHRIGKLHDPWSPRKVELHGLRLTHPLDRPYARIYVNESKR
jgi:hypothetical protein